MDVSKEFHNPGCYISYSLEKDLRNSSELISALNTAISRFFHFDWGDIDSTDSEENNKAIFSGESVYGIYPGLENGSKLLIKLDPIIPGSKLKRIVTVMYQWES